MSQIDQTKLEILKIVQNMHNKQVEELINNVDKVYSYLQVNPKVEKKPEIHDSINNESEILSVEDSLNDPVIKFILSILAYFDQNLIGENAINIFNKSNTLINEKTIPPYIHEKVKKALLKLAEKIKNKKIQLNPNPKSFLGKYSKDFKYDITCLEEYDVYSRPHNMVDIYLKELQKLSNPLID
jgi:hypothetical protein